MVVPIVSTINVGMEDEMVIVGYRWSKPRFLLLVLSIFLTGGLMLIVLSWKKSIQLKLSHCRCSLNSAEKILIDDEYGQEFVEKVELLFVQYYEKRRSKRYFIHKKIKYVWSSRLNQFMKVFDSNNMKSFASFHDNDMGLEVAVAEARLQFYGDNSIAIDVKSIFYLLCNEAINPFYIFQAFALVLWMCQQYFLFTACIFLLSASSIGITVWETRKQSFALKKAVASHSMVTLFRDNEEIILSSHELVPGDVIILSTPNVVIECDAVLIQGQCIMNESALTGESVPVTKISLPRTNDDSLNIEDHKKHILFCGTYLLQSRSVKNEKVKAIVLRTGFSTMKGELVRSILYPKPVEFKFYTDFIKFFAIFIVFGIIAVIYTAVIWILREATTFEVVVFTLDIFTFVVPPILPAAYTSITAISQRRLKKCDVYCLSSKYINMCAGLDIFCFDKTGTLTEDSLSLQAVIPVQDAEFADPVYEPFKPLNSPLLFAMASSHNLSIIDGAITGNPLDKIVFESINWVLEDNIDCNVVETSCTPVVVSGSVHENEVQYTFDIRYITDIMKLIILKQYPFESSQQRTSVIVRPDNSFNYYIFSKGAPEKIASLCCANTVPTSFKSVLNTHTKEGNRVIACAWKSVPKSFNWDKIKDMSRDDIECNLEFLGLIVLQNFLKPETTDTLQKLKFANIRSVMVTGDNLSTAINVAEQCEMISDGDKVVLVNAELIEMSEKSLLVNFESLNVSLPDQNQPEQFADQDCCVKLMTKNKHHFVLEGHTFNLLRLYNRELLQKVVEQGTVFARMLPEQKVHLVTCLQDLGYQVGMCGDGANDCGALKCAHAGVSLSFAEASVAAPFTSKNQNISCVLSLMREGRASLVSCTGIFKYEVAYCFSLLFVTLILYYFDVLVTIDSYIQAGLRPNDSQFLYWDLVLSVVPAMLCNWQLKCIYQRSQSATSEKIIWDGATNLNIHILIFASNDVHCLYDEFVYKIGNLKLPPTYEVTTLFTACAFSILTAVVIFSEGPPFRQPIYSNSKNINNFFIVNVDILILFNYLPIRVLKTSPEFEYHIIQFGIIIAHCLLSYLLEEYFVRIFVARFLAPCLRSKFGSRRTHEQLKLDLESDASWPPIGATLKQNLPQLINVVKATDYNRKRDRRLDCDELDIGLRNHEFLLTDSDTSLGKYTWRHFCDPILCCETTIRLRLDIKCYDTPFPASIAERRIAEAVVFLSFHSYPSYSGIPSIDVGVNPFCGSPVKQHNTNRSSDRDFTLRGRTSTEGTNWFSVLIGQNCTLSICIIITSSQDNLLFVSNVGVLPLNFIPDGESGVLADAICFTGDVSVLVGDGKRLVGDFACLNLIIPTQHMFHLSTDQDVFLPTNSSPQENSTAMHRNEFSHFIYLGLGCFINTTVIVCLCKEKIKSFKQTRLIKSNQKPIDAIRHHDNFNK
uniref:Cation-transporting ATPase n=1 Tax=Strigamia maritima TaxID=126957 RepID=T1IUY6_STRMM